MDTWPCSAILHAFCEWSCWGGTWEAIHNARFMARWFQRKLSIRGWAGKEEEKWCKLKVAEDDIAFKMAIFKKSLHLNDNTGFFNIIQASKLVLGSLLAKKTFFVQFWAKNFAFSRMANCGSGLPAEWPFRSQNAIEVSDSPLPGGLWVKPLKTHALCSPVYSDIA